MCISKYMFGYIVCKYTSVFFLSSTCSFFPDEKVREAEEKDKLLDLDFVCANRGDMVKKLSLFLLIHVQNKTQILSVDYVLVGNQVPGPDQGQVRRTNNDVRSRRSSTCQAHARDRRQPQHGRTFRRSGRSTRE